MPVAVLVCQAMSGCVWYVEAPVVPGPTPEPIVRLNSRLIQREIIDIDHSGDVQEFVYGDFDPRPGKEFVLTDMCGVTFLSDELEVIKKVDFTQCDWWNGVVRTNPIYVGDVAVVDADSDGACEFFTWDMRFGGSPRLLDHNGNLIWSAYNSQTSMKGFNASFGDVDGDGNVEFCVQDKSRGDELTSHVTLFNNLGEQIWAKELESSVPATIQLLGLRMPDIDDDGTADIVGCDCRSIFVYGQDGSLTRTISIKNSKHLIDAYMHVRLDVKGVQDFILAYDERKGWVFIPFRDNGDWIPIHFKSPPKYYRPTPHFVRLTPADPFLAVGIWSSPGDHWIKYFNPSGRLVFLNTRGNSIYYTLLPISIDSICVVPKSDGITESVLLAGDGKLYRYSAK
ncbi:MAG: hypothetical protein IT367_17660 [Candidatus Hydrogenedentes bacterium]|nr:hypothetical protein [Candidatus Hydrogenedentota bacterium]